ncbi:MAG: hypothetical protein QOH60_1951 [Mycobacterium sp.]|jgi:hypothetical protein|nr:hypothetical protein [Mycobacterium sp.]
MSASQLVIAGDVVTKVHKPGTDPVALAARLRVAAAVGALLSPLDTEPELAQTRWRTRWPRVEPVPPDPEDAPWAGAPRLSGLSRCSGCSDSLSQLHDPRSSDEDRHSGASHR